MPDSAFCPEGDEGSSLPTWERPPPQGDGPKEPAPGHIAQAQGLGVRGVPEGVGRRG